MVRVMETRDTDQVIRLWNDCVEAGEVLYKPMDPEIFRAKFVENEGDDPLNLLVAEMDGRIVGFLHGVSPCSFRGGKPGFAYLTVMLVDRAYRRQGIGRELLDTFRRRQKELGATTLFVSSVNPVNLSWRIPGTPGHDHNNMPGVDADCEGTPFLLHMGFTDRIHEVSMYIDLSTYRMDPSVQQIREKLAGEGIITGVYDPWSNYNYDLMCDHVNGDYWRDVLRNEIRCHQEGVANTDPRFVAEGHPTEGPRPILAAVSPELRRIVGFTGPVDVQKSGRGWFTGICTDPEFEHRGIATVLFNLLMQNFVDVGAQFTTLFTGVSNHAQKVYRRAGLRPVREFILMSCPL